MWPILLNKIVMDIILREDIKGLGYKNDTVKVKAGYGRNYLIPKGVAILASKSNRKMIDENGPKIYSDEPFNILQNAAANEEAPCSRASIDKKYTKEKRHHLAQLVKIKQNIVNHELTYKA